MRKLTYIIIGVVLLGALSLDAQYAAISVRNGASDPAQCQPKSTNIFYNTTTFLLKSCTASNVWTPYVQSGGAGGWPLLAPNGTSTAPSYSFLNGATLGMYANTNLALAQGTGTLLITGTTAPPGALTTALVLVAGNINSCAHSYQTTFVTVGGETSAGTTSNSVTNDGTHQQNTLASVPLGNRFVTSRKIYRNTCATPTIYQLQQTIADNTTTTGVQDNTADAGLGATIPASNTAIDTRTTIANNGAAALYGTATNDNAAAGQIGEFVTGTVAANTTSLTSPTAINVGANTNISLTAGDWECSAVVNFTPAATTSITQLRGGVSTTTGTLPAQDSYFGYATAANVPTAIVLSWVAPTVRLSLASTTNVFLVAQATFSASTLTTGGTIRCIRMR